MEELPIQFFLAFDSNSIIDEMNIDVKPEDKHKITLYSYNEKLNTDAYKIIYENEIETFEPNAISALLTSQPINAIFAAVS